RKTSEPQNTCQKSWSRHTHPELVTNDVRTPRWSNIFVQKVLELVAASGKTTEKELRCAGHSRADQAIVQVGSLRRQDAEPLRQFRSVAISTAIDVERPYSPSAT